MQATTGRILRQTSEALLVQRGEQLEAYRWSPLRPPGDRWVLVYRGTSEASAKEASGLR